MELCHHFYSNVCNLTAASGLLPRLMLIGMVRRLKLVIDWRNYPAGVKDQPSRSYKCFNICVKGTRLIRSTGWVEQPIVLLSKSIQQPIDPIKLPLVAPLQCDATPSPLPLRWRRHFNIFDTSAREGVHHSNVLACSPLSHPCLKDASQCGSPGFAEQPI